MATTLTLSCGANKTVFNVNLKNQENLNRIVSANQLRQKNVTLFNFSQKECKIQDKSLYTQLCEALKNLQTLGGNKNVIDDADFTNGLKQPNCEDKKWHCDSCEDVKELTYHTNNQTKFIHITTANNEE